LAPYEPELSAKPTTMKKFVVAVTFFISILCFQQVIAQCNTDELCTTCTSKLATGYSFLKTYKISGEQDLAKVEYSYVFTKGTQYMLTLCEPTANASSIIMSVFDSKRNKVASNKINGAIVAAIAFPCNATGIYYIQYTFEGTTNRCGGSGLGFKRL